MKRKSDTQHTKKRKKRRCSTYSIADRLSMLHEYEAKDWTISQAVEHFAVDRATFIGWTKSKKLLQDAFADKAQTNNIRRAGAGRKPKTAAVEVEILGRLKKKSRDEIICVAEEVASEVFEDMTEAAKTKWVTRFMNRHHLVEVDSSSSTESEPRRPVRRNRVVTKTTDDNSSDQSSEDEPIFFVSKSAKVVDDDEDSTMQMIDIYEDNAEITQQSEADDGDAEYSSGEEGQLVRSSKALQELIIGDSDYEVEDDTQEEVDLTVQSTLWDVIDRIVHQEEAVVTQKDVQRGTVIGVQQTKKRFVSFKSFRDGSNTKLYFQDEDLTSLQPDVDISGVIISFFIHQYLPSNSRVFVFDCQFFGSLKIYEKQYGTSPSGYMRYKDMTGAVDWLQHDYIIIPVNENLHWSFVVFEAINGDESRRTVAYHIDSITGYHDRVSVIKTISTYIKHELQTKNSFDFQGVKQVVSVSCGQQGSHSRDCGVYVMHYMQNIYDAIIDNRDYDLRSNIVSLCSGLKTHRCKKFRKKLLQVIMSST